jgi:hypothetical protein
LGGIACEIAGLLKVTHESTAMVLIWRFTRNDRPYKFAHSVWNFWPVVLVAPLNDQAVSGFGPIVKAEHSGVDPTVSL